MKNLLILYNLRKFSQIQISKNIRPLNPIVNEKLIEKLLLA